MKWKSFKEEMPKPESQILIRYINADYKYLELTTVKRPFDVNPEKYNPNYFQILRKTHFDPPSWVDICEDVKREFEWLDPFEDRKIAEST